MNIIEAQDVDLIEPFPMSQAKRAYGWLHAYKNIVEHDLFPQNFEEFEAFLGALLPYAKSYGIIDKYNKLNIKHEAPIVGMIVLEPTSLWNCYIHIASTRRCWGSGFMDQGIRAVLDHVFEVYPNITRISAFVLSNNHPVKGLARRLGFKFEGILEDMVCQRGEPKDIIHFGMTKRRWLGSVGEVSTSEEALTPKKHDLSIDNTEVTPDTLLSNIDE